ARLASTDYHGRTAAQSASGNTARRSDPAHEHRRAIRRHCKEQQIAKPISGNVSICNLQWPFCNLQSLHRHNPRMAKSLLTRYLDPAVLSRIDSRQIEPRGLVLGNLAGAHKSPLSGFAVEFAGHREYVRGDDTRHIDWRLYFKRDKYFVKQYEMETNFVCHLVLDVSASMRYGDGPQQKMLYAAQMATTLGYAVVRQSDQVSLSTFDEVLRGTIAPGNSMAQIVRLTEHLDGIEPVQKTRMPECLIELAGRFGRREIVMIFSDFFTDLAALEAALQRM